jgi:hypothetical protein
VLGLVRKILGIQHLIIRYEEGFSTSPFEPVGREPRRGNMDNPSVWAQSEYKTLQQEIRAYAGTITTMRMCAVTKASSHKAILS